MLAAWRRKVRNPDKPSRLFLEAPHQLRESEAPFVAGLFRKAAEIADWLEMDAPYSRGQVRGEPHYLPNGVGVYPSHEGRDEDDAETCLSAIFDGLELLVPERPSPQGSVYLVINAIELKKDG